MLFVFLSTVLMSTSQNGFTQWNEQKNFGSNPGKLDMFTYGKDDSSASKPLLIVLHGCGQNAKEVAELTGWNKLADLHHFWVLYPQQAFRNNSSLCFNWFLRKDIEKGQGESESIFQMIQYMKQHHAISENEIYITGLSAGAAMSMAMLSTRPEVFKAGAVFAGAAYKTAQNMWRVPGTVDRSILIQHVKNENPSYTGKYPFLIVYQGLNDLIVAPKNADLIITQWTGIQDSSPYPSYTDSVYLGNKDIIRSEYKNKAGELIAIAYRMKNMGHRIPVKPGSKTDEGGTIGLFGIDKNFHSTYQTALEFGLIKPN